MFVNHNFDFWKKNSPINWMTNFYILRKGEWEEEEKEDEKKEDV